MGKRSAEPSLRSYIVEIHEEMSGLLDKLVDAQKR